MAFLEVIPELIVAGVYYQIGAWIGFIFHTPNVLYEKFTLWPQILGIFCAILIGVVLTVIKLNYKQIKFIHFYIMTLGTVFVFICGLIFVVNPEDAQYGIFLGGIGHGIIYVTGLSYVHYRSCGAYRAPKIAFCHTIYLLGIATTVQGPYIVNYFPYIDIVYNSGWYILSSSISAFGVLLVNELLHGTGVYDYKKCLDPLLNEANKKKDNFKSALQKKETDETNYWTNRLNPAQQLYQGTPNRNKQILLTLLMLATKTKGVLMFSAVLLSLTSFASLSFLLLGDFYIAFYFMVGGSIVGLLFSIFTSNKFIYAGLSVAYSIFLVIAIILIDFDNNQMFTVFMWIFYALIGASYFTPDANIMEVSSIKFTEIILSIGYIMEAFPFTIMIFLFHMHTELLIHDTFQAAIYSNSMPFVGITIVLVILVILYGPKTLKMSIIHIQHLINYGSVPLNEPAVPTVPITTRQTANSNSNPPGYPQYQQTPPDYHHPYHPALSYPTHQPPAGTNLPPPSFYPQFPHHSYQMPQGRINEGYDYDSIDSKKMLPRLNSISEGVNK